MYMAENNNNDIRFITWREKSSNNLLLRLQIWFQNDVIEPSDFVISQHSITFLSGCVTEYCVLNNFIIIYFNNNEQIFISCRWDLDKYVRRLSILSDNVKNNIQYNLKLILEQHSNDFHIL